MFFAATATLSFTDVYCLEPSFLTLLCCNLPRLHCLLWFYRDAKPVIAAISVCAVFLDWAQNEWFMKDCQLSTLWSICSHPIFVSSCIHYLFKGPQMFFREPFSQFFFLLRLAVCLDLKRSKMKTAPSSPMFETSVSLKVEFGIKTSRFAWKRWHDASIWCGFLHCPVALFCSSEFHTKYQQHKLT